jgi:NADH-quinone oxidoreductase subunit N
MTFSMVSLAGIPPLAGFFGKFLLLKAAIEQAASNPGYLCVSLVAVAGVVISLYYYFGVIRAIYWSRETPDLAPIRTSLPIRAALFACMAGMLFIGAYPAPLLRAAERAVEILK